MTLPCLVDSHCHLCFDELEKDIDGVLARAREAGVRRFLNIATTVEDCAKVRKLAERYEDVFCSVGVHPHEAKNPISENELVAASVHQKVVAIGETGLDYHYDFSPRADQESNFRAHIAAAMRTGLPLVVHTREAEEDTLRILRNVIEERAVHHEKLTGVLHCFSSAPYLAREALEMGFYISFSGIVTFKKSEELRAVAKEVPMDRLLVETDSPYLAPQSKRGKVCEPAFVAETAQMVADVKGVSMPALAAQTTDNFFRLFDKVTPL